MSDEKINTGEIKKKALLGVISLQIRSQFLQIIALIGQFILAALLSPSAYGVYALVSSVINFLNYFQDVGLGGALIQKKEEPTRDDLVTTFSIQLLLIGLSVSIMVYFSEAISQYYNLDSGGLLFLRLFAVSFLISSLKTIPSILLERKLEFHKLVIPQVVESLAFYIVAILLAMRGFGIASYAWATLLRSVLGTLCIYAIYPWMPAFKINIQSAKQLLKFGIPYQAPSFLALLKDDLIILYIARVLPLASVGYIKFAKQMSEVAMRNVMDNVIRVTFPTFARLQHDTHLLAGAIHKALRLLTLLILPIGVGTFFVIEPVIQLIPRYAKWLPALPSFYLFTIAFILATLSTPIYNALNALGKVKITFGLQIMWTVLTWIFVPLMVALVGFNGFAIAALIINITSILPLILIKRYVPLSVVKNVQEPIFASLSLFCVLVIIHFVLPTPLSKLIGSVVVGGLTYSLVIYYFMGTELKSYISLMRGKNK